MGALLPCHFNSSSQADVNYTDDQASLARHGWRMGRPCRLSVSSMGHMGDCLPYGPHWTWTGTFGICAAIGALVIAGFMFYGAYSYLSLIIKIIIVMYVCMTELVY